MSGTLFVVATPIGNLEDITLRALRVLREVDLIAAEDTRRTARLLAHYSIQTPTRSFHRHNVRQRLPGLIRQLKEGASVAVVTDAGTPGISDPGLELVRECLASAVRVEPIPGPSAPLTAAVASGFPLDPLTILGFPPVRSEARTVWIVNACTISHTFTFFEAPHRVLRTLTDISTRLGERHICVARELTKVHEQLIRGRATDVIGQITDPRGEFTVVVGPSAAVQPDKPPGSDRELIAEFGLLTEQSDLTRRQVIAKVARRHGRSTRDLYSLIERLKKEGE